jgi:hypothetical protein
LQGIDGLSVDRIGMTLCWGIADVYTCVPDVLWEIRGELFPKTDVFAVENQVLSLHLESHDFQLLSAEENQKMSFGGNPYLQFAVEQFDSPAQ